MEMDQTRVNDKVPEIYPELRRKDKRPFFGEVTPQGELILRESGLISIPYHILGEIWEDVMHFDARDNAISSLEYFPVNKLKNILTLDLRNNKIEILPDSLCSLSTLTCLHLDKNILPVLPQDIGKLINLETLTVGCNFLPFVPNSITSLTSLKTLILSENKLKYLPPDIGELSNLRVLYLHKNWFSEIPLSFQLLENLKELSLEWFRYASPPLPRILKAHIGEAMIGSLRTLCSKLYTNKDRECNVITFLHHFSEEEFDINQVDNKKRSILHIAAAEGDCGVIKGLTESGVEIDVQDKDGSSPILLAIKEDHIESVKILLNSGADVNEGGGPLGSPLHLAAFKVDSWLVRELLKRKADPNSKDCEGNTPMHIILGVFNKNKYKSQLIGDMLIEAGAHLNSLNNEKWAPIHLAARRGQSDSIKWVIHQNQILAKAGRETFDINLQGGSHYWTPMHLAGHAGHFEIVQLLVEAGAQLFIRNSDGRTPRQSSKGDLALFKYLIRAEKAVLNRQVLQSWQSFDIKEEPKKKCEDPVSEALNPNNQMWKRYNAIYELMENKMVDELSEIAEKIDCTVIKAEVVYLLSQIGNSKVTNSISVLAEREGERLAYIESNYALDTFRYGGVF